MTSVATASTVAPARASRTPLWPIALAAGLALVVGGTTLARHGSDAAGLELLNRHLARLGFLFFLPIYAASPLRTLVPSTFTRALVRARRSLGLGYALVMAAHLAAIVAWYATPEVVLEPRPRRRARSRVRPRPGRRPRPAAAAGGRLGEAPARVRPR